MIRSIPILATFAAAVLLAAGILLSPGPTAAQEVEIDEWPVPWENTRPRDPYVESPERIWFVGQRGDYLGLLDPRSGDIERWELEAGAGPHNLIVDRSGTVWYAGNRAAHIGRFDPATGEIEKIAMPEGARDPHTLAFDPEGDIWFTVQGGNRVGHLDVESGEVRILEVPTPSARPYGIVVDPEGRPWFTEFGTHKIGTVDPATMELREYELPRADARPRRLARTSDGMIWYVDYATGHLGRLDPATGEVREWTTPGGSDSRPYGMTVDAEDRLWFVESGPSPNRLVGYDPSTGAFTVPTPIPSGGGTVRHMMYHPPTNTVWFGTDTNTIGRATLP